MTTLAEHVRNAIRQLKEGETIGRRQTPVISFWPMRPKWERWGNSPWTYSGRDGDYVREGNTHIYPAKLRLVYFRTGDKVCQLAYKEAEEVSWSADAPASLEVQNRAFIEYDKVSVPAECPIGL